MTMKMSAEERIVKSGQSGGMEEQKASILSAGESQLEYGVQAVGRCTSTEYSEWRARKVNPPVPHLVPRDPTR